MAGVKALRKLQLGLEGTKGTALAATTIWRGMGMLEDTREVIMVDEDVGYLSGVNRSYTPKLEARLSMAATPATFEQLPYIFDAGIHTDAAAADGTGSGYVYAYVFPTTAADTISTYTIEGGDDFEAEEMEYSFVEGFALEGAAGASWMMSADWVGRQCSTSTFTGALTIPTVEEVIFGKSKLYIDADTATIGTTQQTTTFLAASLNVTTGWKPVYTGDGNKYFTFDKNVGPQITLDVTFEHDAFAQLQKDGWRSESPQQVRIIVEGTALTTAATYTYKTLIIDLAGKWETFDKIDELNGNDVVRGRLVGGYSSAGALFCEIIVVNELAALP